MWLKINGYPRYSINKFGVVRNDKTGRLLRPGTNASGYQHVVLRENNKSKTHAIHRLVANAYLGVRPSGYEINHKNGRTYDNRLENLEYISRLENMRHSLSLRIVRAKKFSNPMSQNGCEKVSSHPLTIDFHRDEYFIGGRKVHLPYGERITLRLLIQNRDRVVTRDEIKNQFGRKFDATSRTADVLICRIRGLLGKDLIETVPLSGYRISQRIAPAT